MGVREKEGVCGGGESVLEGVCVCVRLRYGIRVSVCMTLYV